jgi:hypothetical protein
MVVPCHCTFVQTHRQHKRKNEPQRQPWASDGGVLPVRVLTACWSSGTLLSAQFFCESKTSLKDKVCFSKGDKRSQISNLNSILNN